MESVGGLARASPKPTAGVMVVREDDLVVPQRPTHGAEASSSRSGLPALNTAVAGLEQERGPAGAPSAYFNKAQAEQALWQEFRDHGALLNNVLNEALQIHAALRGRSSRYMLSVSNSRFSLAAFAPVRSSDLAFSHVSFIVDRSLRVVLERGTTPSIN
jgi:hypothetical protein